MNGYDILHFHHKCTYLCVYIYIYLLYIIYKYTPYIYIYTICTYIRYIYIHHMYFPVLVFGSQSVNLLVHFFTPPCHLRLMKLKLPGQVAVLAASDIVGQSPFACLLLRETEWWKPGDSIFNLHSCFTAVGKASQHDPCSWIGKFFEVT